MFTAFSREVIKDGSGTAACIKLQPRYRWALAATEYILTAAAAMRRPSRASRVVQQSIPVTQWMNNTTSKYRHIRLQCKVE